MHIHGGSIHIDHPHAYNTLIPDVPGSADYGIATAQADYIVGAQVDDANSADIYLAAQDHTPSFGQRLVENQVGCGGAAAPAAFTLNTTATFSSGSYTITASSTLAGATDGMIVTGVNIPLGDRIAAGGISGTTITLVAQTTGGTSGSYEPVTIAGGLRGVEISSGDYNATVTTTSMGSGCNLAASAVVQQDGTADPSTAVFANASASYSTLHSIYGSIIYSTTVLPGTGAPTLSNQYHACVNVGTTAPAIHLPASPPIGTQYTVDDCTGAANLHNITILPAAGFIDGATSYVISSSFGSWTGYYAGLRWKTIASCKASPC